MMENYLYAMKNLELSGPTNVAPVIKSAIKRADNSKTIYNSKKYQILLLLTDGEICDMPRV